MAEFEPRVGTTHEHRTNGIRSLRYLAPVLLLALLMSCAPKAESTSSTTVWRDLDLQKTPDRGLISLTLGLDIFQDPAGSLGMLTSNNDTGETRIVSKEVKPNPGVLVDKIVKRGKGDSTFHPVSPINIGDEEIVYVATLSDSEKSDYRALSYARKYYIIRTDNQTLKIKFEGFEWIAPPESLPMRDAPTSPAK